MNSYVCKSNNKDVKLKFVEKGYIGLNPKRATQNTRKFLQSERQILKRFNLYQTNGSSFFFEGIGFKFKEIRINELINKYKSTNISYKFKTFGILSAVFLAIHSIFLGIKFDIQVYKLMRRLVLLLFIIFEIQWFSYSRFN